MLDWAKTFGLKTVVFRHSSMYGRRQFATHDQGWIGWFCQKEVEVAKKRLTEPFTISGNGKQVRDLLHADDMVTLYFSTLDAIEQASGEGFNIGGGMGNSLSLLELFSLLEDMLGITMTYDRLPPRQADQKVFVADTAKAERLIGWKPQVSARDGVARMIEWVRPNG